jgi:hypothetical protein
MDSIYFLHENINRLSHMERGDAVDIKAFDFEDMTELRKYYESRELNLPNPVFFYEYSSRKFTSALDVLYSMQTQFICSEKMISTLESVRAFNYRKYPISILGDVAVKFQDNPDGYKMPDPYSNPQKYKNQSIRDDMCIFQTTELLDALDMEKSVFYPPSASDKARGRHGDVREYVLQEPKNGFPPVFRLSTDPIPLFISAEARMALKMAGIKGLSFLSLKGFSPTSQLEIDVPV